MIRLRPSGADEVLIKRVQDWYEPGPGVFIQSLTASFSPAMLFTGTTNGVWYDPSDLTTLFQDAAGTTPVTAVEQPVGLMLDKSKGLVLGPELVTNGDFSQGTTGWSAANASSSISASGGTLTLTRIGGGKAAAVTSITTTPNKWYSLNGTVVSSSNTSLIGLLYFSAGNSSTDYAGIAYSSLSVQNGDKLFKFRATQSTTYIFCVIDNVSSAGEATIDNISVRELPGNHAFQSTSANRPTLSARYNLLTKSEQFDDGVWTKSGLLAFGSGSVANTTATLDPIGGNTAELIVVDGNTSTHNVSRNAWPITSSVGTAVVSTYSIYLKAFGYNYVNISFSTGEFGSQQRLAINLITGQIQSVTTTVSEAVASNVGTGWWRVKITATSSDNRYTTGDIYVTPTATSNTTFIPSYTGDGTSGIYVWGADLRVANDALNQPAYQRVNTATDYDTVGFKPYLRFNGTNQWLQTNSIDFTNTAQMFVSAGVRKLSEGNTSYTAVIAEFSAAVAANSGSFLLTGRNTVDNAYYEFVSRGTTLKFSADSNSANSAPITSVISGIGDINGAPTDKVILRVNGAQSAINTEDQGAVNYGNYPLYIGARAGSNYWFNGRLYQLIVAGKQASDSEITNTETFINQKTGAY